MFVFAVPALLVVLLGYVVGYGLWASIAGDAGAETAGWITGVLLLVGLVVAVVSRRRRSRRRRS